MTPKLDTVASPYARQDKSVRKKEQFAAQALRRLQEDPRVFD